MEQALTKQPKFFIPATLIAAFALGVLGAFAMAPHSYWFLLFFTLSGFYLLLVHSKNLWHAMATGWLLGLGYHLFGLSWIGNAFKVEGNPFSWVYPLAVAGLPMVLAFFPALVGVISKRFFALKTLYGFAGFIGLMALAEWLRGHIFTGFPWNLYGHAWSDMLPVIQIVYWTDVYFLTLLTVFWMSVPGFLFTASGLGRKGKSALVLAAALSFAFCQGLGTWRLNNNPTRYHEDISVRIVQPNILQSEKWRREKMVANFYRHVDLSHAEAESSGTTYIVWPETALNQWFAKDKSSMAAITDALKSHEGTAYLMTGILRKEADQQQYYNSLVLIDESGKTLQAYDKSHLVPFGEYIPFQQLIPIKPVVQFSGFQPGGGPQNFATPEGISFSPLICYEVIFSGKVVENRAAAPDFIVNITNDAWYGRSAGPHQHFAQAVFRAVEEGVPVVRSANTGVSGLVDSLGRALYRTDLFEETAETLQLPKKIDRSVKNIYFNSYFVWAVLLSLLIIGTRHKN